MKTVLYSISMAFSMFSVFPSVKTGWNSGNMRYMLCALPLVGCAIGIICCVAAQLCDAACPDTLLRGAVLTVLPVMLSGGIHLDGFCDTADALASHAEPERMREIMKDSHTGAFAVIALCVYMILYLAGCCSVSDNRLFFIFPVISRSVGALGGIVIRGTGENGLLASFRDSASKTSTLILTLWILACLMFLAYISPLYAAVSGAGGGFCLIITKYLADKKFKGMSGDTAGYLNALTELTVLLLCAFSGRIGGIS